MGQTFKAAVAMPNGTIEIQNFQTPDPKPDAGLLKVAVTGVCGSDWMFFQDFPKFKGPLFWVTRLWAMCKKWAPLPAPSGA